MYFPHVLEARQPNERCQCVWCCATSALFFQDEAIAAVREKDCFHVAGQNSKWNELPYQTLLSGYQNSIVGEGRAERDLHDTDICYSHHTDHN